MSTAIDYFSLGHPLTRMRSHYAWQAREQMFQRFMRAFNPGPESKVLDLGVTPDMSLYESNHFEQRYPWPRQLTAVSIEDISCLAARFPDVTFHRIEPGPLPFEDRQFDALFCSAVIEHVGSREQQAQFIGELARVSKAFMLTTPNRWFPLEFHTIMPLIHWLPRRTHQFLLRAMGKDFWSQPENLNLLGTADLLRMMPAGATTRVESVKLFGWPSNLIAWGKW